MRKELVLADSVDVAVIIGGRTDEGGTHAPGVEAELSLAREAQVPVVIVGSPGGQAAIVAARERRSEVPWVNLGNGLSAELNRQIADEDDYAAAARILWERFGAQTP